MRKKDFTNKWISERLGAFPSAWDPRSLKYQTPFVAEPDLPDKYTELLDYCPDNFERNQGNIGSCVGWDFSFVIEVQSTLFAKDQPTNERALALTNLSAGWMYYWSRVHSIPPVPPHISGSTNFGAARALHKVGIALEVDVPTDTKAPWDGIKSSPEIEKRALNYKIYSYHKVPCDPTSIKSAIYGVSKPLPYKMPDGSPGKTPLAGAFPIYKSFKESYDDGIVPMPKPGETLLGGHSSMFFGHDIIDDKKYLENFGSWGPDVGDNGIFHIPEEYPYYPNDWYLLMPIEPGPEPEPEPQPDWRYCGLPDWLKNMLGCERPWKENPT